MGFFSNFAQEAVPTVTSYTDTTTTVSGPGAAFWILYFAFIAVLIVAVWKVFTKAGEAGWQSIIPIWSTIVLLRIVGRPAWWILLMFIPFVNFVILVIISLDLGKSFGKSTVFSVFGLLIFSVIGYLILGFGDDQYVGPGGEAAAPSAPAAV